MVWPLKTTRGKLYFGWFSTDLWAESWRREEFGFFSGYHEIGNRWRPSTFTDGGCRGIEPCTSYSRTNDYVKLWLRHCVQLYAQQHHAWAQCDEQQEHRRAHGRAQHAVLSTLRAAHWCTMVSHRTLAQVRLARVIPSMHVHLCVASWLFSPRLSCPLLRPTVLLPALPDVYLRVQRRVQREVQVQPPVRLPLGDRGHFWLRDTPHRFCVVPRKDPSTSRIQRSLEEKDWRGHDREKLQRFWRYQWRADWVRVEHLPRIHNVAALR